MSKNIIEKNKRDNIDLSQIEEFSDLPISEKEIIVIEPNNKIAITIRKCLIKIGFEDIQICKEAKNGIEIFSHFIKNDLNVPIIIDSGSNKNIKKTIEQIQEIQPSANVIITTSKEKTNSGIQKLFDMGVSSTIRKPIIFEDLKKSFPHTEEATPEQFEKLHKLQKQIQEIESQKEEAVQSSSEQPTKGSIQKDPKLLLLSHRKITDRKFKDIHKIEESEVGETIKNALNSKNIVLDKEILEATCNQCDSTNMSYTAECPQCHGINFEQKDLVEHYECGEIYPKEPNYRTCKKCNKDIGSPGTHYREFSGYHTCSSCNERFDRPLFQFSCFDCGNNSIDVLASWNKSKLYKIQQ